MKKIKVMGNYTPDATKALKGSDKIICRTADDGTIYICTGYVLYKMTGEEYAAAAQPVTCCEPGNWTITNGEKQDGATFDAVKIFTDATKAAETGGTLTRCPLNLDTEKALAWSYYSADKDFAAFYNCKYVSALHPGATFRAAGATSGAVAYMDGEPFAMVMPIRPEAKPAEAVKAYFTQADKTKTAAEADKLRDKLTAARAEIAQAQDEIEALRAQIAQQAAELEALRSAPQAEPVNEKPEPKTAAELIAARFADLEGVTATIKGAQTAAPVVWLAGETEKHADAIKAAGAKWSNKKSAFYVRVA